MHRWIASAAGGTSQRLKPGAATVRSRSRKSRNGTDDRSLADARAQAKSAAAFFNVWKMPHKRGAATATHASATSAGDVERGVGGGAFMEGRASTPKLFAFSW